MEDRIRGGRRVARCVAAVALAVAGAALAGCSDTKVHDLPQAEAILAEEGVSEDDIRMAEALRGSIEAVREERAGSAPTTVDEYIGSLREGRWPGKGDGWPSEGADSNPKLWIRLARFAERWTEDATGEDWDVLELAYPFPYGTPIPTGRDEDTAVTAVLICNSAGHGGCVVMTRYYRWAAEPRMGFDGTPDEAKAKMSLARVENQKIAAAGGGGWDVLGSGSGSTWVMPPSDASGGTVPTGITEAGENAGRYLYWVPRSKSLDLAYMPCGHYPNETSLEDVPLAKARDLLLTGWYRVEDAGHRIDRQGDGDGDRSGGTVTGMSWDTPGEAFEAAGFDMVFPAEVCGSSAREYQTLDRPDGKILSVEYWQGDMGTLIADATIRKEEGAEVSLGNYATHSKRSVTADMDGTEVRIDGDSELTRARWSTEDEEGRQWAFSVVVWQQLSDEEILAIARQVK